MFTPKKSEAYITQSDVDFWYKEIYNLVKEQKEIADKQHKLLLIALGEDHGSKKSLFLTEIFIEVAKQFSINLFQTEGDPLMLESLSSYKKATNIQFLAPIVHNKKMHLKAAEKNPIEILSEKPKTVESGRFYLVKEKDKNWQLFKVDEHGMLEELPIMVHMPSLYLESAIMRKNPQDLSLDEKFFIQEQVSSLQEEPLSEVDAIALRESQIAKSLAEEKEDEIFLGGVAHLKSVADKFSSNSNFHVALFNISNFSKEEIKDRLKENIEGSSEDENEQASLAYIRNTTLFFMSDKVKQLVVENEILNPEDIESMIDKATQGRTSKLDPTQHS